MKISADIEGLVPYPPGKPLEELARELGIRNAIKLASNENPLGPSRKALAAIRKGLSRLHRYPDGAAYALREALSKRWKVEPGQIILGNGSNEVIELLVRTLILPGDEAIMADRTFSLYRLMVTAGHGVAVRVPLKNECHDLPAMAERVGPRTRLMFICNPNNPTGTIIRRDEVQALLRQVPRDVLLVFDEAYGEYVTDPAFPDSVQMLREGGHLIVLRTFSKIYGLAGLRVGYGIAPAELVGYLDRVRQPFNTSAVGQWAALAALADEGHVTRSREVNAAGKAAVGKGFDRLGIRYFPTQTNFIYFEVPCDGREVYERLLREGVIIRHIEGNRLRVTLGRPVENRRFLKAFEKVISAVSTGSLSTKSRLGDRSL